MEQLLKLSLFLPAHPKKLSKRFAETYPKSLVSEPVKLYNIND